MIRGRHTEEGKHIIHYLINYPHYTEGKSEPGRRAGLLGTARVFLAATACAQWRNPPSPLSPCPGSHKTTPKEKRANGWQSLLQNSSSPPGTPLLLGTASSRLCFYPFFSSFPTCPPTLIPVRCDSPTQARYRCPAPPSPKRCC